MMSNAIRSFKEAFEIQGELGRLVDAATSEMQLGVDWQANMQICDKINSSSRSEDIKDAIRSLRARLKTKNVAVQMLALTLLEALVKNCGPELHLQVATRDMMYDLQQLAVPGNADGRVTHKVQQLLQAWGEAFAEMRREIPLFHDTYQGLLESGVQFPPFDPSIAPAFVRPSDAREPPRSSWSPDSQPRGSTAMVEGRAGLGGVAVFDVKMLKADLEKVDVEVSILTDTLTAAAADASKEEPAQHETQKLIKELVRNCSTYQNRIVSLIEAIPESVQEQVIPLLLQANEEILRVLELHSESSPHLCQKAPPLPPPPVKGNLRLKSGIRGVASESHQEARSRSDTAGDEHAAAPEDKNVQASGDEEDQDLQMLLGSPPAADTTRIAAVPAAVPAPLPPPPAPLAPPPSRSLQAHASSPTKQSAVVVGVEEGWGGEEDDLAELLGSSIVQVPGDIAAAVQPGSAAATPGHSNRADLTEQVGGSESARPATALSPVEDDFTSLVLKHDELQTLPGVAEGAGHKADSENARDEPAAMDFRAADASSSRDHNSDGIVAGIPEPISIGGEALPRLASPPKAVTVAATASARKADSLCGGEGGAEAGTAASGEDLIQF